MGTNYYAIIGAAEPCAHCGHAPERRRLHIGKSSMGWTFGLHVEPDDPEHPSTWEEWRTLLNRQDVAIEDEYGERHTLSDLVAVVERRSCCWRNPTPEWLEENGAVPGPNNLARRKLGHFAVAHGEGPWDLCVGHFR